MDRRGTQSNQIVVMAPMGHLDLASAAQMRQKLQAHLDAGETRLLVDLSGVPYLDSAGLGEVVRGMKRAREAGGDLRLCGLGETVLGVLELTGLNKAIIIYPTRDNALASWR